MSTENAKETKEQMLERLKSDFTETEQVILRRRSVRWYKKEPVPEFMIKRILEAGRFAPSAGNSQPWKFIVIRDARVIEDLTNTVVSICKVFRAILDYRTPGNAWKYPIAQLYVKLMPNKLHPVPFGAISLIADRKLGLYHGASTVILIFKDVRGVTNPDLDCGIAGQNMALAAHSLGLGTCWVSFTSTAFDYSRKWKKFFGIKHPYKFASSLAIGWPLGSPDGLVSRPPHTVDWYENGTKQIVDPGEASPFGFWEKRTIPRYNDPAQTKWGDIAFDYDKCIKCGNCARICPASSIVMKDDHGPVKAEGYHYLCMACGDCMAICKHDAVTVKSSYRFSKLFKTVDHADPLPPRL